MIAHTQRELARILSINVGTLNRYTKEKWFPARRGGAWDPAECFAAINEHRRFPLPCPPELKSQVVHHREQEARVEGVCASEDVAALLLEKQGRIVERLLEIMESENSNAALGALNQLCKLTFGKRVLVERRGEESDVNLEPGFADRFNKIMGHLERKYGAS